MKYEVCSIFVNSRSLIFVKCQGQIFNFHFHFIPCDAMLEWYMLSLCVCACVCLSDTHQYCVKTAKRKIVQTMPHDSLDAKGVSEIRGTKCMLSGLKLTTFDK